MKRLFAWPRILGAITFLLAVIFIATPLCRAQQSDSLAGTWNMSSLTPDGDHVDWTLVITQKDGNYTGAIKDSENGQEPAKDFKVDGDKIHLRVSYQGDDYDIDLTHDGNSLKGTWSGNGQNGETSGKKASTT